LIVKKSQKTEVAYKLKELNETFKAQKQKSSSMNCSFVFGALQEIMVEPNTISEEYGIVWRRPKIDLDELVFLRKKKAYSYKELASHFGRPVNTIDWYLRRLRAENKL